MEVQIIEHVDLNYFSTLEKIDEICDSCPSKSDLLASFMTCFFF